MNFHMDDDIRVEKNQNGIETYIFDPYNPLNKPIEKPDIEQIFKNYVRKCLRNLIEVIQIIRDTHGGRSTK